MIDHLIYATHDLDRTVDELTRRLGVAPAAGGHHLGLGTRNALLSLGSCYLELLGPDPGQHRPSGGYWYGLENIEESRLITWSARVEHIERVASYAHGRGYNPGDVHKVFRETPDGGVLSFRLTMPTGDGGGVVPNLIEWDEVSPHPSTTSPHGVELVQLRGYHPVPESIRSMLEALRVDLEVRIADRPKLVAILDSPYGPVELS